jgi:hypothetical protein
MTVVGADRYAARRRLEATLEKLERLLGPADTYEAPDADELAVPLARAVVLLARYVLATQR